MSVHTVGLPMEGYTIVTSVPESRMDRIVSSNRLPASDDFTSLPRYPDQGSKVASSFFSIYSQWI